MNIDIPQRYVRRLLAMSPDEQREWIRNCGPHDLLVLDAAFEAWAQDGQIAPSKEGWRVWLMMAGRGYGKTRGGAEWIHSLAMVGDKRIALTEGCDKRFATCRTRFANSENFRGEPHLPGNDLLTRYPGG